MSLIVTVSDIAASSGHSLHPRQSRKLLWKFGASCVPDQLYQDMVEHIRGPVLPVCKIVIGQNTVKCSI